MTAKIFWMTMPLKQVTHQQMSMGHVDFPAYICLVNTVNLELPQALLEGLEGIKGYDRTSFVQVHQSGEQVTSVRFNPARMPSPVPEGATAIPWTSHGYYLPQRPSFTFDPAFHGGRYYVQEASSMFLEQALKQNLDLEQPLRVLDLCAAPGGKSTLIQSLITPESLLVSNDVIKSRAAILEENLTKWGAANSIVTNNDPAIFGRLEGFFDALVIDAPCSGSGLFRRDEEAISEWSEHNVQLCSQRQQRILADSYPCLKEGGLLVYSTCSYSKEEDEDIVDWLMQEFDLESLSIVIESDWGIVETQSAHTQGYGYRFFPDKVRGEGLFLACFRKRDGTTANLRTPKKTKWQKIPKAENEVIQPWLIPHLPIQLWKQGDMIIAFPSALEQELAIVSEHCYLRKAGIIIGKVAGTNLVPDHALALSKLLHDKIVEVSLNKEDALQYLRREEVKIVDAPTGWTLVKYETMALGWVKILPNRINNYYPQAWRIMKSGNN